MPTLTIRIPQLGEGLQEALLVERLKGVGDHIKRDETLYLMETDKATTEVESPYDGKIVQWLVEPGTVVAIGTEIAIIETSASTNHSDERQADRASSTLQTPQLLTAADDPASASATPRKVRTRRHIPPRTMKYLKQKGLLDVADQIPINGTKMMPADIDNYLQASTTRLTDNEHYQVIELPSSQVTLNYRLARSAQTCVTASVTSEITWSRIEAARETARTWHGPSAFAISCWCVVQALKQHAPFRSVMRPDNKSLKVFSQVNLGIAVALPNDQLLTAVVTDAGDMNQSGFFAAYKEAVAAARQGRDQVNEATTVIVSNIGSVGMRSGTPVIVAPAMATLAIGEAFFQPVPQGSGFQFKRAVIATLSFDHRITNGVGAATFVNAIKSHAETFTLSAAPLTVGADK